MLAGGVLAGALAVTPPPAWAQSGGGAGEAEGIRLEAEAGYDGRYLVGRRLPVTVTIRADRLVRGAVEITVEGQPGSWSVPVEVPGGSDKEVVVVVPTPIAFALAEVQVRLLGAGDPVAVEADVEALESEEIVGLLPAVTPADLPAPFAFPQEVGSARFAALRPETLAIAGAIDPVGTLVAGAEEVGALDGTARAALLDWVDRGGRLVVDAAAGTEVAGLPDGWQPGATGRAIAGLGEVRLSAGRAAAGDWAAVVEPTPTVSISELQRFGGFFPTQLEAVTDAVARDAGLDALDLPWLLGFLAAYVALAGPLGYFVLRRKRPGLGWVVIPVLAAGFTGLAFVVGADLRSGTRSAHGTVIETSEAGDRATTVVGAVSRTGGDGSANFPAGWTAGSVDTTFFGVTGTEASPTVTTRGEETDVVLPLAAGGFGVMRGVGPTELEGGLRIEAASVDGGVRGTVTNDLPYTVFEVGVFLGRAAERLESLGPGESADFELVGSEFRLNDPFTPPEAEVWPNQSGYGGQPDFTGVVNLALLNEAIFALGPNARPRGVVTAVGWTRDQPSPLAGGDAPGRSAIVARQPVAAATDGLARGAARREFLRGPAGMDLPDDRELGGSIEGALWQFTLPAGTPDFPLSIDVPGYLARVDVWDGTAWQTIDRAGTQFDPNRGVDITRVHPVAVPATARRGDVVLVRGFVIVDFGAVDGGGLDLYSTGDRP